MTASITYNLPDDAAQHRIAVNADFIISELCEIQRNLRIYAKDPLFFESAQEAVDKWSREMKELFKLIEE